MGKPIFEHQLLALVLSVERCLQLFTAWAALTKRLGQLGGNA